MGGLGVANSQNTRNIMRRLEKEHELCPNDSHQYGKWGDWSGHWQKADRYGFHKTYVQKVRRKCKRCGKVEFKYAFTEEARLRIESEIRPS